jgi:hypothetical protein
VIADQAADRRAFVPNVAAMKYTVSPAALVRHRTSRRCRCHDDRGDGRRRDQSGWWLVRDHDRGRRGDVAQWPDRCGRLRAATASANTSPRGCWPTVNTSLLSRRNSRRERGCSPPGRAALVFEYEVDRQVLAAGPERVAAHVRVGALGGCGFPALWSDLQQDAAAIEELGDG